MIRKFLNGLFSRVRKVRRPDTGPTDDAQVALPRRADLPLRERSRSLVAVPAQINGACMGSGKF